jgi:ribosomal-protein-alanine N-acetyltransferase
MEMADVPAVFAVEQAGYDFPWSKSLFEQAVSSTKYCAVLELDTEIVAYGIVSYVVGEAELLNICVHPKHQGKGLAKTLLNHLIVHATQKDNHEMFLEVRESNAPAQYLYEKLGFNEIGRRKNYYPGKNGREDAILMALVL